jgi:chromosome segregation ATPase
MVEEKQRIVEERRLAEEEAFAAELEERQMRINIAQEQYEEGKKQHTDAMDELALYQELLAEINRDDDPGLYDETEWELRQIQMRIGALEDAYDSVRNELDSLNRDEKRIEAELADYESSLEIR